VLNHLTNVQKALLYLGIVCIFMFLLLVLPIPRSTALFMFVPLASAVAAMALTGQAFAASGWKRLGLHRPAWKSLAPAFLIPLAPIAGGYAVVWATGLGTFGLPAAYEGKELELFIGFFVTMLISALTVTLGEEAGWRGYLASNLEGLAFPAALLANGFVWGLFHLPVMLLTDLYHSDVNPLAYVPLFLITVTLAGAFMTYLRYRTGSVWPPIVAHTVHNVAWNYGDLLTGEPHEAVPYVTGDAGAALILFYAGLFLWIVTKGRLPAWNR